MEKDTGKLCEPETKTQKYIKITIVDQNMETQSKNWLMWERQNSRGGRGDGAEQGEDQELWVSKAY